MKLTGVVDGDDDDDDDDDVQSFSAPGYLNAVLFASATRSLRGKRESSASSIRIYRVALIIILIT